MEEYLIKAIVFTDTNDSKQMVIQESFEDIIKATNRYEELEAGHPIALTLYKAIDKML
jgi:hypothetical protein